MQTSMAVTALFMGLVGGPHCVAMCGAACAGISRAAGERSTQALWSFPAQPHGRVIRCSVPLPRARCRGWRWLGTNTIAIRPVWTMFHAAALLLGLVLIWRARQPAWIDNLGQSVWRKARPVLSRAGAAGFRLCWAWPGRSCPAVCCIRLCWWRRCRPMRWKGPPIMALFSFGTSMSLTIAPWLLAAFAQWRIRGLGHPAGGLALAVTSGWALWMG